MKQVKAMNKILVANRGEIALRIMRTCKEMGIQTVAVFSEADRNAPFVRYADEAVCIGPAPSSQSYLNAENVIQAALKTNAVAVHPGYGFLSENADFARSVLAAGLTFIGPTPEAMDIMGDKLSAKAAAKAHRIPMVPGSDGALLSIEDGIAVAEKIGFPVLIKASAGGGGKGMRIVERKEDLSEQMKLAISEAQSAFGDGAVFIEKYVTSPRHIEIQVLGDEFGNVLYLHERECSIQRRHQKVIEEAPSSVLTPALRKEMGECAVRIAKACNYLGAGTVEFLLDENLNFYFLEMNTRLQVEHPVTEMITGLDLVRAQIEIASGHPIALKQEEVALNGHAIEIRVYAEDPQNQFLPDIGKLVTYRTPSGNGIRVDDGFEEGMQIPIYYDPMIAKLVAHGANRNEAIAKMLRAIADYKISGVKTTLDFCAFALQHEKFVSGDFDTRFIQRYFQPALLDKWSEDEALVAAAFSNYYLDQTLQNDHAVGNQSFHASQEDATGSIWKKNRTRLR